MIAFVVFVLVLDKAFDCSSDAGLFYRQGLFSGLHLGLPGTFVRRVSRHRVGSPPRAMRCADCLNTMNQTNRLVGQGMSNHGRILGELVDGLSAHPLLPAIRVAQIDKQ